MPLQDLTPQLRTRLNRMERGVGWFVFLATALLLFGFGYYMYNVAGERGWFRIKARFHIYVQSSTGLKVGDTVTMMGFSVGKITEVYPMPPQAKQNVRVEFEVFAPYFRYIWSEGSYAKISPAGFLDQRELEVTRGTNGYAICVTQPITIFTNLDVLKGDEDSQTNQWQLAQEIYDENSNLLYRAYTWLNDSNLERIAALKLPGVAAYNDREADKHHIVAWWHPHAHAYEGFRTNDETAWLPVVETPPVADRLQAMISEVQNALPDILGLTNQLAAILNNSAQVTSNLNISVMDTHPLLTNANLTLNHLDTNVNILLAQMSPLVTNANLFVANLNTNVTSTLANLSDISSNLDMQVERDTNMLEGISKTITDYDAFVLGLEHHWLLRSAFKKTNTNSNIKAQSPPPSRSLKTPRQGESP
jgi:ABC-type transporter Mla subunit MlaD